MDNRDTSEKNGYKPVSSNSVEELNLHSDCELLHSRMKINIQRPKIHLIEDQTENAYNRVDMGECPIPKTSGVNEYKYMLYLSTKSK